jgi:UDP-N-acetylmuramate dehydrogenase
MNAAYLATLPLPPVVTSLIGGASVSEAVPLAPLTTLRVGPVARRLITCDTTGKVVDVTRALGADSDALVLAGGSNVVLSDELRNLDVVLLANTEITVEGTVLRAEAGAVWDDVVVTSLAHGLGGLECLSGIPGSAGATPVQNVGAYGAEVADTIKRVRLIDRRTGEDRWVTPASLQFGYRTSVLKGSTAAVVLEVEFDLDPDGRSAPLRYGELADALDAEPDSRVDANRVREAVLALRARKGMVLDEADHDTWSAGSFFTNPILPADVAARLLPDDAPRWPERDGQLKTSAAWLIERSGFGKGYGDGPVRLSTKHTLALTNRGAARTEDLLALAREVRDGVRAKFGITLVNEPVLVGCVL